MKEIGKDVHRVGSATQRKSSAASLHVVPSQGKWEVRSSSSTRARKVCDTAFCAISYARGIQSAKGSAVVVHERNGRVDYIIGKDGRQL